jgi:hypothetical protein
MRIESRAVLSLAAVAAPLVVAAVFSVSGAAALTLGRPLVWAPRAMTPSEAVAVRDRAEFVRQIAAGADPNATFDVYDVMKQGQHIPMTPLEAAVATRQPYMLGLVVENGGRITAENATPLRCFALVEGAVEIAEDLARRFGTDGSCDAVTLPWRKD